MNMMMILITATLSNTRLQGRIWVTTKILPLTQEVFGVWCWITLLLLKSSSYSLWKTILAYPSIQSACGVCFAAG